MSTFAQQRYGHRGTARRRALLTMAAGLALFAALGFIGWVTITHSPPVSWDDVGYHVLSDGEIEVTFDVSFSRSTPSTRPSAICSVQALNELRTEVGLRDVRVQAGPGGRVRATATLRTSERATTGVIRSCVPATS